MVEIISDWSIALHVSHCSSSHRTLAGITSQPSSILYGGIIISCGHAPIHALFTQGVTGDQNSEPSVGCHASISQLALTLPVFSGEIYGSWLLTTKMRSFLRLFSPPLGASIMHYSQTCAHRRGVGGVGSWHLRVGCARAWARAPIRYQGSISQLAFTSLPSAHSIQGSLLLTTTMRLPWPVKPLAGASMVHYDQICAYKV